MKIHTLIILLLVSFGAYAQAPLIEKGRSVNLEPARSPAIVPFSSAEEAAPNYDGHRRYVIPIGDWECENVAGGSTFKSSFGAPFSWIGREMFLCVESASAPYSISINGRNIGECYNPTMPAQFNVTRYLAGELDTPISITLRADASTSELEAWGSDELKLGNVVMMSQPTMSIRDIVVSTTRGAGALNASISIAVKSEALNPRTSRINYELLTPSGSVALRGYSDVNIEMRHRDSIFLFAQIPDSLAWSVDSPNLYRLNMSTQYRGRHMEYISVDLGFRAIESSKDGGVLVNGVEQNLKGVQLAIGATVDQVVKAKEDGYNLVQFAAGEYNEALYRVADSIGLFIIATAPINTSHSGGSVLLGGNPTNDPSRLGEYIERVDAIYNITRLHPSVVAYSIADESFNGFNLYESFLYLKQQESQRPVIYQGAMSQWNSDKLRVEFE